MDGRGAIGAAAVELRGVLAKAKRDDALLRQLIDAQSEVIAKYQPMFAPDRIGALTEEEFRGFLMFRNNRHWIALQRMGPAICSDMGRLRQALTILGDESRSVRERLNQLVPFRGTAFVPRLGKAVLTPILLISHPDRYGVWNQVSEAALQQLRLWPDFDSGVPLGERYERINGLLLELVAEVNVDLWTLDGLFWRVLDPYLGKNGGEQTETGGESDVTVASQLGGPTSVMGFGLERHLQDFLRDNWDRTSLGTAWKLHEEDGEEVGYEYPCAVGRIDLLAHHRTEPRWLVIELKRNQTSDQTVGQVLRYVGWVKRNLAQPEERVEGLVIAQESDEAIRYALSATTGIALKHYEVEFKLKDV